MGLGNLWSTDATLGVVFRSIQSRGYRATMLVTLSRLSDLWFDWVHGTDTYQWTERRKLAIPPERLAGIEPYHPSHAWPLRRLLNQLFDSDSAANGVFLDVGCGKGRAMMVAALAGYRRIRGIEMSLPMADAARRNLDAFGRPRNASFEVVAGDAISEPLRDDEAVVYLFNPFDGISTRHFAQLLTESVNRAPRKMLLVYSTPEHREVFDNDPTFELQRARRILGQEFLIYRVRPSAIVMDKPAADSRPAHAGVDSLSRVSAPPPAIRGIGMTQVVHFSGRAAAYSVIIPVRNGADFVGELLDSLQAQEGRDGRFEIIAVDDGSTDATPQILNTYPWLRVITHVDCRGAGAARNSGARAATGEVLIFLDSDTRVRDPQFLVSCVELMAGRPQYDAFSGCYYDENPDRTPFAVYLDAVEATMRAGGLDRDARGTLNGSICGIRKAAFEAVGGFSENRNVALEDIDLGLRLGSAGHAHWFSSRLRVEHRQPDLRGYLRELLPRARHYVRLIGRFHTFSAVMGGRSEGFARSGFLLGNACLLAGLAIPQLGLAGLGLLGFRTWRNRALLTRLAPRLRWTDWPKTYLYHLMTSTTLLVGAVLGGFDYARLVAGRWRIDCLMAIAFVRSLLTRRTGGYLIHFLTHRCNAHCAHCFDHPQRARIGVDEELDLARIRRVAASAGPMGHVSLTGGEPTLRDDLAEILEAYYRAGTRSFSLPTNGSKPRRLAALLPRIFATAPNAHLIVKLSLDGFGDQHDRIRGVPGLYRRVEQSLDVLCELRSQYPQLRIHVCFTLSDQAGDEIDALLARLRHFSPDQIELNRMRGQPADKRLGSVADSAYDDAVARFAAASGNSGGLARMLAWLDRRMSSIVRDPDQAWPCGTCLAGRRLQVIQADGTVLPCEMIQTVRADVVAENDGFVMGRLADHGDDLQALLDSAPARRVTGFIHATNCRCSFECAILATISYRPWRLWRFLLPRRRQGEAE